MSGKRNANNVMKREASCGKIDSKPSSKVNSTMEMKIEYEQLVLKEKKLDKELALLLRNVKDGPAGKCQIMEQLHIYNDVKDVTQVVLGSLARLEDVTVTELHERFGLSYKDNDA